MVNRKIPMMAEIVLCTFCLIVLLFVEERLGSGEFGHGALTKPLFLGNIIGATFVGIGIGSVLLKPRTTLFFLILAALLAGPLHIFIIAPWLFDWAGFVSSTDVGPGGAVYRASWIAILLLLLLPGLEYQRRKSGGVYTPHVS